MICLVTTWVIRWDKFSSMAVVNYTLGKEHPNKLYLPIGADMSLRGSSRSTGTGLRKYLQKQFSSLHLKRTTKQQPSVDYASAEIYSATYKRLQVFQRMYWFISVIRQLDFISLCTFCTWYHRFVSCRCACVFLVCVFLCAASMLCARHPPAWSVLASL